MLIYDMAKNRAKQVGFKKQKKNILHCLKPASLAQFFL